MRHLVPINRQSRAGQISRARQPHAVAFGQLPEFRIPIRNFHQTSKTFRELDGSQSHVIRSHRARCFDDAKPQLGRIDFQFLGNLVQLHFLPESRLRCAMSAFRPAGRLVRESSAALKAIAWNVIRRRLQRAGVERARHAVRSVRAAINQRLQVHRRDRAVFFHASLESHHHGMAAAMAVENFFARQTNFHGTVEHQRGFGNYDLVIEGIALAAESAAIGCGDHANMSRRHLQHLRKRAMQVMRRLCARPNRQLSIGIFDRHRSVLLDRKMRISLIEKSIFENFVRLREPFFDVAKIQRHELVDVS